jgi:hypothetical protein
VPRHSRDAGLVPASAQRGTNTAPCSGKRHERHMKTCEGPAHRPDRRTAGSPAPCRAAKANLRPGHMADGRRPAGAGCSHHSPHGTLGPATTHEEALRRQNRTTKPPLVGHVPDIASGIEIHFPGWAQTLAPTFLIGSLLRNATSWTNGVMCCRFAPA